MLWQPPVPDAIGIFYYVNIAHILQTRNNGCGINLKIYTLGGANSF